MVEGGWGPVHGSRKWHYYQMDGWSLCGRALFFGPMSHLEQGNDRSPDNCAACKRRRKKMIEAEEIRAELRESSIGGKEGGDV